MIVIDTVKLRLFAKRCRQRGRSFSGIRLRRASLDLGSLHVLRSQTLDAPDVTVCLEALEHLNATLDSALDSASRTLEKFSSIMVKAAEQAEKMDRFP